MNVQAYAIVKAHHEAANRYADAANKCAFMALSKRDVFAFETYEGKLNDLRAAKATACKAAQETLASLPVNEVVEIMTKVAAEVPAVKIWNDGY